MNVLDLSNNQEEVFRESLTKQDNKTLEELAKKSKTEVLIFLENQGKIEKNLKTDKIEQKISKIKSVFTPQILGRNPNLAKEFNNLDEE